MHALFTLDSMCLLIFSKKKKKNADVTFKTLDSTKIHSQLIEHTYHHLRRKHANLDPVRAHSQADIQAQAQAKPKTQTHRY